MNPDPLNPDHLNAGVQPVAMEHDEREMLRASLRRLLSETDAAKIPAALDDFGWTELLATDPAEAVGALFAVQGEILVATTALSAVMAGPLLASAGERPAGAGEWTVALPPPGPVPPTRSGPPGPGSAAAAGAPSGPAGPGYAVAAGCSLGRILVVAGDGATTILAASTGQAEPVAGIDPEFGLVRLDVAAPGPAQVLARGDDVGTAWTAAVAAGRRALACELLGVSRAMLALGVGHAGERHQFGQPIGRFQAVKHRLAEAKVALTAAESAVDEAWADPGTLTALLAKLWAGRAARLGARQIQQVLGGMGFTWEHPFHRHLRRVLALDGLLGSAAELHKELGRTLLAGGEVPDLARL